jgi:hypothetical protein
MPYGMRALEPGTNIRSPYYVYKVKQGKEIEVATGLVQPWFNQPGGGVQYYFDKPIQYYLDNGIIEQVKVIYP